jgi:hypothetical protein
MASANYHRLLQPSEVSKKKPAHSLRDRLAECERSGAAILLDQTDIIEPERAAGFAVHAGQTGLFFVRVPLQL